MLIAHISDTHIAGPGLKTNGIAPMAENLERCVTAINALTMRPDLVLLSGDVTNDLTRDEAQRAAEILTGLHSPLYLVPGNHDDRDVLWDVFGGGAIPARADGFVNYVIDGPDLRIIALDTVAQGQSGGAFCKTRAAWLRTTLAEGGDQPTIIFMHHPPLKCGVPETDHDGFDGADMLGAIVADYPNIQRILCGHIHLLTHARWNGTVVTTAPSMGMQLTLDLTQARPSRFCLTDPGYLLHHWTPEKTLITHAVAVRDMDGPYEFRQY
ncbi:phosphodiesterase [Profundibacter sp.]|uniref:phosphodiesterase n=1 Tax=Profundibacter sp. TaxID=3101071 RepID=UPI003D0B3675